jgi:serine/threonine-protein kinase
VLGTPYYMSPEQARGLRSVDYRSDLWSVGVIAYRCVVGTLPFDGEAVGDLLVKLCTAPLPVPSQIAADVPPGFDAWFAKALTREPEGRFASASELAESLGAVCGISVRGSYATGDIPIPSFAGGPMAASGSRLPSAVQPVTPYPHPRADGTGPNPAIISGVSAASTLQMATGAPTTQTPPPHAPRSTGTLLAAAAVGVVVLGIGVGIGLKVLGGTSAETLPRPSETATPLELPPTPKAPPVVPPATAAVPSQVEPPASAAPPVVPVASVAAVPKPVRPQPQPPHPVRPKPPGTPTPSTDVGF